MRSSVAAFCILIAALPTPASAQNAGVKLVIISGPQGGVTTVDYPSPARCERAAAVVEAEWKRRYEEAKQRAQREPNTIVVGPAFTAFAFCIPS